MIRRCYIVGAGEFYGEFAPQQGDLVIAADGGLVHLEKMGISADILIGDFDSLEAEVESENCTRTHIKQAIKNSVLPEGVKSCGMQPDENCVPDSSDGICAHIPQIIKYPVMKDETDMFLAYKTGAKLGCNEFLIYGGVGGREDHTFANYCLLSHAKNEGNYACLYGKGYRVFVVKNEKVSLRGKAGANVSVFAFGGDARGVSIKGLKYEADDIILHANIPLGVSNSYTEEERGEISVSDGALLVIEEIEK